MQIVPSIEKLHAIKGMFKLVIFTIGVGMLHWSFEPIHACYVSKNMTTSIFIWMTLVPRYINLLSSNYQTIKLTYTPTH